MNAPYSSIPVLFAQMGGKTINDLIPPELTRPRQSNDVYLLIGAVLGAVLLITLVIAFFRRKKIRRLGTLSRSAWPPEASKNQDPGGTLQRREHRQHGRRKRREHRPRNPTLADTGGLPPRRPEDEAPPGL